MVDPNLKLQMKLLESEFPFSKRMVNFFSIAEVTTVADLTTIPLSKFTCFRGFKKKCKEELVNFIEHEKIQNLFKNYESWK